MPVGAEACTGCGACVAACASAAISLCEDERGFLRAHVEPERCVSCGACERVCLARKTAVPERAKRPAVYGGWSIHHWSVGNSGGLFTAFGERWIEDGGAVVAPAYTEDFALEHCVATDMRTLARQAWSKFAQSDASAAFGEVKERLERGQSVLFVGSPCQVRGLYAFLGGDKEGLTTAQFPCMGTPSQKSLRGYACALGACGPQEIAQFKAEVTLEPNDAARYMVLTRQNGTQKTEPASASAFVRLWNESLLVDDLCLSCTENQFPHAADLTWGNFWYLGTVERCPQMLEAPEKRVSMLIVNSPKGKAAMERMRDGLVLFERSLREAMTGHVMFQAPWRNHVMMRRFCNSERRMRFLQDERKMTFTELAKRYAPPRSDAGQQRAFSMATRLPLRTKGIIWRAIYGVQAIKNAFDGRKGEKA